MSLGILLIAHGSRQAQANDDLHFFAQQLQQNGYPITVASYLELAEPDILSGAEECIARGADRLIMVPYFLSAGVHVQRDLTQARATLAQRYPGLCFQLAEPLGRHALLLKILTERIESALKDDSSE